MSNTVEHEPDGPQPFLAYVRLGRSSKQWVIARHVNGDTEWWNENGWNDGWGLHGDACMHFDSLAAARAYANERGWE